MRISSGLAVALAVSISANTASIAEERPVDDYTVTPDIVYGTGIISSDDGQVSRDLSMDLWQPAGETTDLRPTVIFTHGGSWHLGSPRFTYDVGGARTTSPADYCRDYASRGYNCFAIEYRLTQENPVPSGDGYSEDLLDPSAIGLVIERVNQVRVADGLRPLDPETGKDRQIMLNGIRAATEDLAKAHGFILANSDRYNVHPDRIALQGFSAGAVTSVHVAYALKLPVAAVIANSGGPVGFDITGTVSADSPPLLLFVGQHDLEGAIELAPVVRDIFAGAGATLEFAWVPGAGHFYSKASTSLGADLHRLSIEERIAQFLARTLGE